MPEIKYFLFDLDDTAIGTRELFRVQMQEVYRILSVVLNGVAQETIKEQFEALNNAAYKTHNVNPKRWDIVLDNFKQIHRSIPDKTIDECRETLMQIYTMVPKVLPGAVEAFDTLQQNNFGLYVVTHAWQEVTDFKLTQTGLKDYFDGHVHVANMDRPKNSRSWKDATKIFGLQTRYVASVGDSPTTDMKASAEAGIKHRYYAHDPNQWVMHDGELPKGTHILENGIIDLIPLLRKQGVL